MIIRHLMIAGAVCAATLTAPPASADNRAAERAYDSAMRAAKRNDHGYAAGQLRRAVEFSPAAKYKAAWCEVSAEGFARGSLEPGELTAACKAAGRPEVANKARRRRADALAKEARDEQKDSDYDDAIAKYKEAIAVLSRPEYHRGLCEAFEAAGDVAKATRACAKAAAGGDARAKTKLAALRDAPSATQAQVIEGLEKCTDAARWGDAEQAATRACVDQFAAAAKAGVRDDHLMKVPDDYKGKIVREQRHSYGWYRFAKVDDARAFVRGLFTARAAGPLQQQLASAQSYLDAVIEKGERFDQYDIIQHQLAIPKCREAIKTARDSGAPADLEIEVKGKRIKLGDAEGLICAPLDTRLTALAKADEERRRAAHEKLYAPYKKALRGGKLKVMVDNDLANIRLYGPGGRELKTPRSLARSRVWFYWLRDKDDFGRAVWTVYAFRFRGNKLADKTKVSGYGFQPPKRAFR